jgi:hypothetical protein
MDLASALIGLIAFALFIVPIVIINRGQKKRKEHMVQSLHKIALEHNSQIADHEVCGDFAIGVDPANKMVFFFKKTRDQETAQFLDLKTIEKSTVMNASRAFNNQKLVDRLELRFLPMTKDKTPVDFLFYDAEVNMQMNGQLLSAEQWSKRINELIKSKH